MSHLIQGSDAWHTLRKTKIGGSDAPIIMGVSPWKTPTQLWQEKVSPIVCEKKSASMQRGNDLEPVARELFSLKTGIDMHPDVLFSNNYDWQMASLDGIDVSKSNIVEIKCPNPNGEDHAMALNRKIPEKYYPQLQHQLAVVNLDMAYYFSFDGIDGVIVEVQRNQEYIEMMIQAEKEFYQCMINSIPPTSTEKDFSFREDEIWSQAATEWKFVTDQIKQLEEKQKKLRNDLIKLAGQSNAKGAGITLSKSLRKGVVDIDLIPVLQGIDLEPYRKPATEMWRISVN